MSVLVDTEIKKLVDENRLIGDFQEKSLEGASYDMRLGHQYAKFGEVHTLTDTRPSLVILPGEFSILRSLEVLNMPLNLVGHNGIMSPWAKRGLVSLFSPQIDPGFCGFLIVPVFNAGDQQITLNYREKIFTVEFVRTTHLASYGWTQKHGRQDEFNVPVSPSYVRPNLIDIEVLRKELASLQGQFREMLNQQSAITSDFKIIQNRFADSREARNYRLGWWTLVVAIVTLFVGTIVGVISSDWIRSQLIQKAPAPSSTVQPP